MIGSGGLVLAVLLLAGCGPGDGPATRREVAATAEAFLTAVIDGDSAALAEIAPALPADRLTAGPVGERLAAATGAISLSAEDVSLEGRAATVQVSPGADATDATNVLVVPLRYRRGRWVVTDSLRVVQRIDVVPLDPAAAE